MTLLGDIHFQDQTAANVISKTLINAYDGGDNHIPVFFHVGATSSSGDALGPFVGWFLQRKGFKGLYVGDLQDPVHAVNIKEKINDAWLMAMKLSKFPYLIAVDAAVGRPGRVTITDEPLKPGAGMGKNLPEVGKVKIMGGTTHFPFMMWFAGLDQTVAMAEVIADGLMGFHAWWEARNAVQQAAPAIEADTADDEVWT